MRYLITLPVALFTCACASQVPIGAGDDTSPLKQNQNGDDAGGSTPGIDSGAAPPANQDSGSAGMDSGAPADDAGGNATGNDANVPDAASPANRVVLFGGENGPTDSPISDTWVYDGTRWTQADVVGPSARTAPWMASLNGKVVLFGGSAAEESDGGYPLLSDTWTFDGSTWTQVTGPGPSGRMASASATAGGKAVLFGGGDANGNFLNDTWTFDGTAWSQVNTTTAPSPREDPGMAGLGDKIILFGGENTTDRDGDMWSFDGTTWTELTIPNGPAARANPVMASLGTNKVALFGGITETTYEQDTWTFDGTAWTQVNVMSPQAPTATPFNGAIFLTDGYTEWTFDGATFTTLTFTLYPVVPSSRLGEGLATIL